MSEIAALPATSVDPDDGELVADLDALLTQLENDPLSELEGDLAVRALLLDLRRGRYEADRIRRLRDNVLTPYELALERLSVREQRIRAVLAEYLDRSGRCRVSIPDAGCAFQTRKRSGGSARIVDRDAFEDTLAQLPLSEQERRSLYREQLDAKRALETLERFYATTPDGHLVDRSSGEFVELPGVQVEPEAHELAVRLDG